MDPELAAISTRRIRQSNEIAVLRALHRLGPLSRAELARAVGLNRSSSGHIVASLLGAGLVRETAGEVERPEPGRVGRPGIRFELVPEAVAFIGIEVGVEHISIVEIDLDARIVTHHLEPFDGPNVPGEAALERAVRLAVDVVDPARLDHCEGVGLAVPAQMSRLGHVRVAPLLRWEDFDVAAVVRALLPVAVPVLIENDGNAFAIGATYRHGDLRRGVTLSVVLETGIGAGIAIDGSLLRGAHGLAGEIGHMLVPDGAEGMRTLEAVIGLEPLLATYAARVGIERPELGHFLERVRDREPGAVTVAEEWSRTLAYALAQIARVIDPEHIVLGGSLARLYPLVSARLAAHFRALQEESFPVPSIAMDDAEWGSAFGAACMLHQRFLSLEGQDPPERVLPHQEAAPG